jgi:hypothetical protein
MFVIFKGHKILKQLIFFFKIINRNIHNNNNNILKYFYISIYLILVLINLFLIIKNE